MVLHARCDGLCLPQGLAQAGGFSADALPTVLLVKLEELVTYLVGSISVRAAGLWKKCRHLVGDSVTCERKLQWTDSFLNIGIPMLEHTLSGRPTPQDHEVFEWIGDDWGQHGGN